LGNFPLFPRLRTLFLAQNRIQNIQANISHVIPNLTTLVLTRNRIAQLSDLDPLGDFKHLVYLSLIGNPVTNKEVSGMRVRKHNAELGTDRALYHSITGIGLYGAVPLFGSWILRK
jgi:Leucine-rich repeat (LRR) protein